VGLAVPAHLARLDGDGEDGVGARALLVHEGRARDAVLLARLEDGVHLLGGLDHDGRQLLDVDLVVGVLLELELVGGVLAEQVADLLVVDLEVRGAREELLRRVVVRVDRVEDVLEGVRDHAALLGGVREALHGVRLARARLAVLRVGGRERKRGWGMGKGGR
jgi:hypothetical protein